MNVLQDKANEIKSELDGVGAGYGIEPASIIAIITAVITLFKNCNTPPEQALQRAERNRLLDRWRLRRIVQRHCDGNCEAVEAALRDCCGGLTVEEMQAMYEEVE